jgi:preprotein translocase subunit SecY
MVPGVKFHKVYLCFAQLSNMVKWVQMFSGQRVPVVELCIMCTIKSQIVIQINDAELRQGLST